MKYAGGPPIAIKTDGGYIRNAVFYKTNNLLISHTKKTYNAVYKYDLYKTNDGKRFLVETRSERRFKHKLFTKDIELDSIELSCAIYDNEINIRNILIKEFSHLSRKEIEDLSGWEIPEF